MKILSEKLKYERKGKGLTQRQFAVILGISQGTYMHYELIGELNGREPPLELLCKMADFFGVTVDYLLGRED